MSTRAPSGALSLACVVRIPSLVLIEMLANNQLQHRLVAETALRTLCPERLDECVVQRDRPRARLSMDPPQAARFGDRGAQVRTLEGALLRVAVRVRLCFRLVRFIESPFIAPHWPARDRPEQAAPAGDDDGKLAPGRL